MKKIQNYLSAAALCLIIVSCSLPKKSIKGFQINGVTSIKTSMAYLINAQGKTIDSSKISGRKFNFNGVIDSPSFYTIGLKNQTQRVVFIIENTDFEITITPKNHIIIGGELQEEFTQYKHRISDLQETTVHYQELHKKKPSKQLKYKIDSISSLKQTVIITNMEHYLNHDIARYVFIHELKETASTALLNRLKSVSKSNKNTQLTTLIDAQISVISTAEKERALAILKKRVEIKKIKRQPAPMFHGESLGGGDLSLQEVLRGKKAVLIDFWASWCGPCRQITPLVKSLHQKYKSQGFTILTVSEDKTRDAWRNGVINDGMSEWNHIFDDSMRIAYMFNVGSIPHMVLIDANGGIVKNKISINDLEREIQKLVK